jgi:hypothetical protein
MTAPAAEALTLEPALPDEPLKIVSRTEVRDRAQIWQAAAGAD